jgi:hypothetical protein
MIRTVTSIALAAMALGALVLAGCAGGGGGSDVWAPTALTATAGSNQVTLVWNAPSLIGLVTGYNVYRSTTPGSGYTLLNSMPLATSPRGYTDSTAVSGTRYYYIIRSTGAGGSLSTASPEAVVTPWGRANGVWSPDGRRLLFISDRSGNDEVYSIGVTGSGLQRLTYTPNEEGYPSWSPDGTQIAYSVLVGAALRVVIAAPDGTGATAVGPDGAYQPAWSPDGERIAYVLGTDIWTMNASDGSDPVQITSAAGNNYQPDWSPDGSQLTFTSDRSGAFRVYVCDADGANPLAVSDVTGSPSAPAWTPDGTRITFVSSHVYSVLPDGSGQTDIIASSDYDYRLSPDGLKAAYVDWVSATATNVFVAQPDGTGATNITNTDDHDWLH